MNKEPIESLLAALRGGKYKQGKLFLRKENCFCFSGVICDLYDPRRWAPKDKNGIYRYPSIEDESLLAFPPKEVYEWVGLTIKETAYYINKNDRGISFLELADELERKRRPA